MGRGTPILMEPKHHPAVGLVQEGRVLARKADPEGPQARCRGQQVRVMWERRVPGRRHSPPPRPQGAEQGVRQGLVPREGVPWGCHWESE